MAFRAAASRRSFCLPCFLVGFIEIHADKRIAPDFKPRFPFALLFSIGRSLGLGMIFSRRERKADLRSAGQPGRLSPRELGLLLHQEDFFHAINLFQLNFDDFVHCGLHGASDECGFDR